MSGTKTYDHQAEPAKETAGRETQLAANDYEHNPLKLYARPKLFVGAGNDPYEQEADNMADTIMRMPASHFVQRKCAHCEEEEKKVQRKSISIDTIPSIQAKQDSVSQALQDSKGSGEQMDRTTQSFMENRFGSDFSRVKIHTNEEAVQMSRELNAKAFTNGNDIYFNDGQYQPGSDSGKHLLAHELTHTIQQNGNAGSAIQREPETTTADPIHDPLLDQYCAETGADRATTTQHDPGFRAWVLSHQPATIAPVIDSSCTNQQMVVNTVVEALRWIDDIYDQLLTFEADSIFGLPGPDFTRVQSALQQTFHTTDSLYVSVIGSRFYHIGRMLREPGRVRIFCGGTGCGASGSSITGAYVDTPYQIHLCSNNPDIATFIHEMCHAVIPTIGIRNTVQRGGGLHDRAYTHERVFHHLTPEESLDNAEAYGVLADGLHNRRTGNLVTPQIDTIQGTCPDATMPLAAIARAEQAVRWGWRMLEAWLEFIQGTTNRQITDLPADDQSFIATHLPAIQSVADMRALYNSFTTLYTSGYVGNNVDMRCIGNASSCANNVVGVANGGRVTTSAVNVVTQTATGDIDLCDTWFSLPENDRIRTVFALRLFGLGPGGKGAISNADGLTLADYCLAVQQQQMPAPTTRDAAAHISADQPTGP